MRRIIFFGILIFVFSIGIGYYYSALWKNGENDIAYENTNEKEVIKETSSQEEKISYDATFALKKYYKCGHFKFQYAELPKEMINSTRLDIEKSYPEWEIEEFSSKNLVLSQKIDNLCDEHYVIKIGDDDNKEKKNITDTGEELYKNTNISKEYLTSTDIDNLEKGIYVYGIGNLNSAIEDFE